MIYFDSAATTFQKPQRVCKGVQQAMRTCASVGRGGHRAAELAAKTVFDCRIAAADLFDAQAQQVVFTMNATHGLNIALHTLVQPGVNVVVSGFEHNAVMRPLYALGAEIITVGRRPFDDDCLLEEFEAALRRRPSAAVFTHCSNVFGYILPIDQMSKLCRQYEVPFVIDASQSAGILPVRLKESGADFIAAPGHKGLYGPQGTGILLCAKAAEPLLFGGTGSNSAQMQMPEFLPDRLEAGTHNVCGIAGLLEGIRFVKKRTPQTIFAHECALRRRLEAHLQQMPRVHLYTAPHSSGVLSFTADGVDCEEFADRLAHRGIAVRAGLHCAPLAHQSAGTFESGTVRVSFSAFNTAQEVERFAQICKKLLLNI